MSKIKFVLILIVLVFSSFMSGLQISNDVNNARFEDSLGNSIENIEALKIDCEKSLPRDQECTLLYEFVPTKTKGEQ